MDSDSINRKSKNSSKRVKFKDENGNSKHSSEDSGSSNDSDALSEILNSIEGTKSNGNSGIIKGSGNKNDDEIHKGPKDESGRSNRSEVAQGEIDRSKGDMSTENISSPPSSSSSSLSSPSSGSSTDDKSQADTQESGISGLTSGKSSSILKRTQNGSAGSTSNSQVPIVAQESALTQSPPIQVMDRGVEEYDPYRIPSAVFSVSKSSAPMDWSLASNDSLFSIKVGSTSFARDLIQNKETARGVEKPGEVNALIPFPAVAPTYTENFEFDKSKETVVSDDAVKDKTALTAEEPIVDKSLSIAPWNQPNISESRIGQCSFDFPVKNKSKKKCAWPSCSCSGCSWAFCYCSNYSCALCYCWNCSLKRFCCCCSDSEDESNVSEEEKVQQKLQEKPNVSKKEKVQQKQQEKPLASALKSKSACSNCWNCSLKRFCCCCSDSEDESNVSEEEKVQEKLQEKPNVSKKEVKQKQEEKPLASALKSKSACSNCCNCSLKRFCCCCSDSEDESNVSEEEKVQQKQQEKPLASALKSKSACSNCCSWFPSCRWRWCCSFNRCKGKCCC
ncbi:hypothetical protein ERO13_A12G161000v2 [Gossypium hirsutum]|uniref:Uncharacterized protein isoform X1 n=1 Tax=Gossypium hirsutum TaxID=3635 RepID=A0A1U8M7H6_GOSHI|nr:uncharacterized protein LOC107934728 isoform X1 [Gossypium hirsutum]XP_016722715.2 uncharacterized protein LOC107934728 isoform X1 [Gossypium hirsutum]KAG4170666.1 hypothetical protein ERO13_A12G161000v2 [Gossypium hirsutum]